jgi:polar amino acid transport system ATP-binding protein
MLDPPTSGEIIFNGVNLCEKRADIDAARKKMGMVFQNFGLFGHMTVIENICAAPKKLLKKTKAEAIQKAEELLKTVGLSERAGHYPHTLSGGQKQRVAIARCLAMEPEVILFDEPTSALDPTMVGEVMAVIRKLAADGMTMLIVTHEMSFARSVSNRIFYMDEGIIYEDGSPAEIFDAPAKPKTQAFINRVQAFTYEIHSSDFDFIEMLSGVENFCSKHAIAHAKAERLRLICEELVVNLLLPFTSEITLSVSFSDKTNRYEIAAEYGGASYNPLESTDYLSALVVMGMTKEINHSYDGELNTLKLLLTDKKEIGKL